MSAIFGIIDRLGGTINRACVDRMLAALAHRGPDGQSTECGEGFALGHCLLDTSGTGPAMGRMLIEGDFVIAADCRIDNRDELAASLDVPATASDTLMLLRAYLRWGDEFPSHVLGDFAFAIWNAREKTLFCVRDHFGVKPFFYFNSPRYLVFASEPGAVLASGLADAAVCEGHIADFLAASPPEYDQTSFRNLLRLRPAHYGRLAQSGWHVAAYWTLPRPATRAWADAPGEFRRLLTQAVAARLRGGRAGTMLSGGLDSSSIACIAERQLQSTQAGGLPTFSLVFDETPGLSERPFIEAVVARGGFAPSFIPSSRLAHFAELDSIIDEQQDLFLAPNLACSRQIYQYAKAEGVRILLDGHGGDEVAPVGSGRLDELAAEGRWIALWRVLDSALLQPGQRKMPTYWKFLKHYGPLRKFVPAARSVCRRLGLSRGHPNPFIACINPGFAAQTRVAARSSKQNARLPGRAVTEQSFHHETLTGKLQSSVFEILDRTAAAAGIEARYPFWDKRLVEFCLSLEPAEKLNNGWGRLILRRAMEGILPPIIQWRRLKFDFTTHLAASIVRDHAALVLQTLDDHRNGLEDYIDLPAVRLMMDRLQAEAAQPNGYEVQAIFRTMVLAFWLKRRHEFVPADAVS